MWWTTPLRGAMGKLKSRATAGLRIFAHQMSVAELVRNKWPWTAALLLLICGIHQRSVEFSGHVLCRPTVIVRQNGTQVLRLRLPSQLRTRMLHVSEGQDRQQCRREPRHHCRSSITEKLLSLQSTRRRGRWTIVARPRAAHAPAPQPASRQRSIYGPSMFQSSLQKTEPSRSTCCTARPNDRRCAMLHRTLLIGLGGTGIELASEVQDSLRQVLRQGTEVHSDPGD